MASISYISKIRTNLTFLFFFFNDTATTEIYTLSLHDALPISASVEERVPAFLKESGRGWVSAEYGMLPRSTNTRTEREAARGRQTGRTQEIQRLIGRALRAVIDLSALGSRSIQVDCDVLQADGGTRTAAITGAFVAVHDALARLQSRKLLAALPVRDFVAA